MARDCDCVPCMCEWQETCGGSGFLRCTGCGGDSCICACGGEPMDCDGCDECPGDEAAIEAECERAEVARG